MAKRYELILYVHCYMPDYESFVTRKGGRAEYRVGSGGAGPMEIGGVIKLDKP
jgi:hypothetical protein